MAVPGHEKHVEVLQSFTLAQGENVGQDGSCRISLKAFRQQHQHGEDDIFRRVVKVERLTMFGELSKQALERIVISPDNMSILNTFIIIACHTSISRAPCENLTQFVREREFHLDPHMWEISRRDSEILNELGVSWTRKKCPAVVWKAIKDGRMTVFKKVVEKSGWDLWPEYFFE